MTASSVEFFPCRVQLMGLPQSAIPNSTTATSTSLGNSIVTIPRRPSLAKVRGVSRNLFGAPDPDEMKILYQQEAERLRSYVLQRYNFDTKTSNPTTEQDQLQQHKPTEIFKNNQSNMCLAKKPIQYATLLEQEFRQHEQRLRNEECNLNRASIETTPPYAKMSNHASSGSKVARESCEQSSSLSSSVERHKPYARQSLLTESFNLRKSKACLTRQNKLSNAEMVILERNSNLRQNFKILELPKAMQTQQGDGELTKETSINYDNKREHDVSGTSGNSGVSCSDNCTTLSIKLVVSSQNVS